MLLALLRILSVKTVILGIVGIIYIFFMSLTGLGNYLIAEVIILVLTVISIKLAKFIKEKMSHKSFLTASQKADLQKAEEADKKAKSGNADKKAEAEKVWQEERAKRLPEIDNRIRELSEEFKTARERLNVNMERLNGMDALCDEEKNLQVIDMLIRFIETRRADSVKEALHEYDKLLTNRQMFEIEKKKLEAEIRRAAEERADRLEKAQAEKLHNYEMECIEKDSAESRKKIANNLDHLTNIIYYDIHA